MIFLDTGYFIALFTPDDDLHDNAIAWSSRLKEPLLVTEYILLECVNAFSKQKNRSSAHALISYVKSNSRCEIVHASPELFNAGLDLHRSRPDKDWSLTDCISFHVMRERGIARALAYDIHFEQSGFEALLRVELH